MGSGNLLKTIIKRVTDESSKQEKGSSASKKSNGFKWKKHQQKQTSVNSFASRNSNTLDMPIEDPAATRIQTAFRAYRARKRLGRLKATVRLQAQTKTNSIKKQATRTLNYLHSWSNIQTQIRACRLCMVTEGRLKQKKIANQLKLEAELHDLEVEWSGGPETMEEVLSKIQQREEAAVKRERTMAYAFSHQWRAPNSNSNNGLGNYEVAKANWGWSWVEHWIAVCPWESRLPTQSITPKKTLNRQINKGDKNSYSPKLKASVSAKPPLSNGKGTVKPRRLSYPGAEKPAARQESNTAEEVNRKKEEIAT